MPVLSEANFGLLNQYFKALSPLSPLARRTTTRKTAQVEMVVADTQRTMRSALAAFLNSMDDIKVVAQADDAEQALDLAIEYQPKVVLFDAILPGRCMCEVAPHIHSRSPDTALVALCGTTPDWLIGQFLRNSVKGFVSKSSGADELRSAIHTVSMGQEFSDSIMRLQVDRIRLTADSDRRGTNRLTDREQGVLVMLAQGMSKAAIAKQLHLSVKTIDNHTTSIMSKLDIHDRVQLARYAIRERFVEP